jgi:hypothetical protein
MLSENSEIKKVTGEIIPCHKPDQKPTLSPPASGTPTVGLVPAAQAASRSTARINIDTINRRFFVMVFLLKLMQSRISSYYTD